MSARYPQGIAPSWYPHSLTVYSGGTRDRYNRVTTTDPKSTTGQVVLRPIEMIEAGARVKRNGARITVAIGFGVSVDVGTVIDWNGEDGVERFTVIGLTKVPDHQGGVHFVVCDCVTKATEA